MSTLHFIRESVYSDENQPYTSMENVYSPFKQSFIANIIKYHFVERDITTKDAS